MSLQPHTRDLIGLAWARRWGFPDDAMTEAVRRQERIEVVTDDDESDRVVFVRLFGASLLAGPRRLVRAARPLDEEVLALETTLLRLARQTTERTARSRGEQALYYAEDPPETTPSATVAVSDDDAHIRRLCALVPVDDLAGTGLTELDAVSSLVPDDGHGTALGDPLAAAGHRVVGGLLADLRVLTVPEVRRKGLGTYAAAVALQRAYEAGLVPQARIALANEGAHKVAAAVGLELYGSQTTVLLER